MGVRVAHVEPPETAPLGFEVNPSAVGQPVSLFTWYSSAGTATTYPNSVGTESFHADSVGGCYYGGTAGVAPGVLHVDDYEASYFVSTYLQTSVSIPGRVVNQSFTYDYVDETNANRMYDDYVVAHGTIFASAVGNGGTPYAAGTAYNSIGVGALGSASQSSVGPSTDGRCKPDIVGPDNYTSFSTPYVAGAAAVLIQAGTSITNSSVYTDSRTLKALLLNGAVKPIGWTNSPAHPLDLRYGAGMLNVFNSYKQHTAGKFVPIETTSNTSNGLHPPGLNATNIFSNVGWSFYSITNQTVASVQQERVNHYYFNLTNTQASTVTATLTWNRQSGQTSINDLDLFLVNCANSNIVALSASRVDNVEHLFLPSLAAGRYDLQVLKKTGGVSTSESYALALETFSESMSIIKSGANVVVSWPTYPDGFVLESTSALGGTWTTVATVPVITNNSNRVTLPATGNQFFHLRRP